MLYTTTIPRDRLDFVLWKAVVSVMNADGELTRAKMQTGKLQAADQG